MRSRFVFRFGWLPGSIPAKLCLRVRTTLVPAAVPAASCFGLALFVLLRLPGHGPAEAQSLRHSAAVAAALGCVPHGQ